MRFPDPSKKTEVTGQPLPPWLHLQGDFTPGMSHPDAQHETAGAQWERPHLLSSSPSLPLPSTVFSPPLKLSSTKNVFNIL